MKKLQELTLFDKFLFDETMDIPEAHEAVLQIIFGDDNLKLLTPAQTEKEIRTAPWLRSIRLDVYAIDQEKRIYNTEAQKAEKKDEIEEERRLFYVGMTRAKEELMIIHGGQPSMFLEELPLSCIEKEKTGKKVSGEEAEQMNLFEFL